MKYCQKCGKEIMDEAVICPACGYSTESKKSLSKSVNYEDVIKSSGTFVTIGLIIVVIGIIIGLFVNAFIGAILCLAAEFVFLTPNTKLTNAFKHNFENPSDKNAYKAELKKVKSEMKSKNTMYKLSFVFAIIALVALIVFALFI